MGKSVQLIITTAFGLEGMAARELRALGYENLEVYNGGVAFEADYAAIARCNLWLRTADRVLIAVGRFTAMTFDELFEKTKALPWEDWIPEDGEFPVIGKSVHSQLFSVSDCQAIVKKAIVERLKKSYHVHWFQETGAFYRVQVALLKNEVTLTIDTSGNALNKRGYRQLTAAAPLKETLAAAMIQISRWRPDRALIDPFCGSGTIPIEAALIGRNIAPGINRDFAAEKWPNIPTALWRTAREEAFDSILHDQPLGIFGYDIDPQVLSLARYHAKKAGFDLDKDVKFQQRDVRELKSRYQYGYVITNPPYGERLMDKRSAEALYQDLPAVFAQIPTWSIYLICAHPEFEQFIGRKADRRRKLYNGRILCQYYQYYGPKPTQLQGPFARKPAAPETETE